MKTTHVTVFARNRAPYLFAHRGASGEMPENTLASFREAARQGADAIEIDLQLTADGRLVAAHDRSLERVSGHSVLVEDTAFGVLRHLSVSRRFPASGRIVLPTIEEIFDALGPEIVLNLDLKCRRAALTRYVDALVRSIEGRRNLVLSSFRWELLAEVRRRAPGHVLMPAVHRRFAAALKTARLLHAPAIAAHHRFLRPRFVHAADLRGLAVLAFTVNDGREAKRLIRMGVQGFFTNFPARLREELANFRRGAAS
jgi:glycerophosphoryl diester phosphodiesterase